MTCSTVFVSYPSAKLLPLVNAAIEWQKNEMQLLDKGHNQRKINYENLPWYKKVFRAGPESLSNSDYWDYAYSRDVCVNAIHELNSVRLTAEVSDVVGISGSCLASIDEWAGN